MYSPDYVKKALKPVPYDDGAEIHVARFVKLAKPVAHQLAEIQEASAEDGEIKAVRESLSTGQ